MDEGKRRRERKYVNQFASSPDFSFFLYILKMLQEIDVCPPSLGHPSAADEELYWPKPVLCSG